jgi:hypothetical protein
VVGVVPAAARQTSLDIEAASKATISIASTHSSRKMSEGLRVGESGSPIVDLTTLPLLDPRLRLWECAHLAFSIHDFWTKQLSALRLSIWSARS